MLGSEDDMVTNFGVSRPTLRQAAALVSQEQLLTIRRGVGGGYFARRPNTRAVTHMTAIYLQTRHTTMAEIIQALEPINIELAILASANDDPAVVASWTDFLKRDKVRRADGSFHEFQKSQVEFIKLLCAASRNNVLELFVLTLYDFCGAARPEDDLLAHHPERVREYWAGRTDLVKAIASGDSEIAAITSRRCARLVSDWLTEGTDHAKKDGQAGLLNFSPLSV
ncbi:hypothetical protein ASE00_13600 [Sphingomonas sp. Root710]|nr:hypothetical protein ASE00_13600 [Sphingomonas sp. Root710]